MRSNVARPTLPADQKNKSTATAKSFSCSQQSMPRSGLADDTALDFRFAFTQCNS